MNKSKIALYLFAVIALLHLSSIALSLDMLDVYTKPFLMTTLLIYFLVNVRKNGHPAYLLIIGALIFSWVGDVLLIFQIKHPNFFLLGLGAFLCSHVLYITSNRRLRNKAGSDELSKPRLARYDFFLVMICFALLLVLIPRIDNIMLFPILVYAVTITYMAITAMHRYGTTTTSSFWLVMVGALLFMFSDSTLAFNKFVTLIPNARLIIMTTYIVAQYFIIEGFIKHAKG
ncbi:MAG: lysoplasmalogenase [Cyclobacteriaceae bacterium]|nr:lysoplasmalogenase [Cyclobacteriaceae bacterium]